MCFLALYFALMSDFIVVLKPRPLRAKKLFPGSADLQRLVSDGFSLKVLSVHAAAAVNHLLLKVEVSAPGRLVLEVGTFLGQNCGQLGRILFPEI